jgi:glycosyltransferase involved in cell wall biosynthesis
MTLSARPTRPLRIAYVVNNAAFFVSHRLGVALAARSAGYQVELMTGQAGSAALEALALRELAAVSMTHCQVSFRSAGVNLFTESIGLLQLAYRVWKFRPDIVHCASPKGILYGGVAARLLGCHGVVLAVSGMGYLFTGPAASWKALLRRCYGSLVRFAYGHPNKRAIVQNLDDLQSLTGLGLACRDEVVLIPGSGVRLDAYAGLDITDKQAIVVLPARMLKDKGVLEFAEAARILRDKGSRWRFALVGTADYQNPTAVPVEQIQAWVDAGFVEWWGHRSDMVAVFGQAAVVCLPSYREGMPKALLEAAAAGCAVVTTDVIGCREAIVPGVTGDLVPAGDPQALAAVLGRLLDDPQRRARYGAAGNALATERFSEYAVIESTLLIYEELNRHAA